MTATSETPSERAARTHTALIRGAIANRDRLRARLELRRSNAAAPHRNRAKYTRKVKHPKREA